MVSVICYYKNKFYDISFMLYEEFLYLMVEFSRKL